LRLKEISGVHIPSKEEFIRGIEEFERHEKRDVMYKIASFYISHFWENPSDLTDGLAVLLLTWNRAFYRYGNLDFDRLEKTIRENMPTLTRYRRRDISIFNENDEADIIKLFNKFLDTLQLSSGKKKGRKSPVSTSKAIHMLAPSFFPLWDNKIAKAYGCNYTKNPTKQYIRFMWIMKDFAKQVKDYINISRYQNKTLLKLIDEYNYAKYTKGWI